jgi:hypothetical protein
MRLQATAGPYSSDHPLEWRSEELLSDDEGTMTRWHIHWISCGAADIDRIQAGLKPWR